MIQKATTSKILVETVNRIKEHSMGISTGFFELDQKLMGFQRSELTILAARSSMGKTALMTRMAIHAATSNKRVAIFSLEMSTYMIMTRLIAAYARVPLAALRKNMLSQDERDQVRKALKELTSLDIWVDDSTTIKPKDIAISIKDAAENDLKPDIIFIDYLQLLGTDGYAMARYQELDHACKELKELAKDQDIPVVVLCQLNRDVEKRQTHEPRVSDLRESGGIEQAADIVLLLHRPAYYALYEDQQEEIDDGEAKIIIGKNRNGPTGKIDCVWIGDWCTFMPNPPTFQEFGE